MLEASRRSILTGLVALVAAPAIVRAGSLMPVNSGLVPDLWFDQESARAGIAQLAQYRYNKDRRSIDVLYGKLQIRPEWGDAPSFIERMNAAYEEQFPADNAPVGAVLRIRLPNDYVVSDGPGLSLQEPVYRSTVLGTKRGHTFARDGSEIIPDSLALTAAAVAVAPVVLAKPVTRRFWAK